MKIKIHRFGCKQLKKLKTAAAATAVPPPPFLQLCHQPNYHLSQFLEHSKSLLLTILYSIVSSHLSKLFQKTFSLKVYYFSWSIFSINILKSLTIEKKVTGLQCLTHKNGHKLYRFVSTKSSLHDIYCWLIFTANGKFSSYPMIMIWAYKTFY